MLQLTWLKIHKFRNVKPGTELHFGPKFNVLLGKNASGKTTLLDLIAAILNDRLWRYETEEGQDYQIEYREISQSHIFHTVHSSLSQEDQFALGQLPLELGVTERRAKLRNWSLQVTDFQSNPVFHCSVRGSSGSCHFGAGEDRDITVDDASKWSMINAFLSGMVHATSDEEKNLIQLLMVIAFFQMMYHSAPRFDEALGAFNRLKLAGPTIGGSPNSYYFPLELTNILTKHLKANSEEYSSPFDFSDVPVLARVLPLLGFVKGELSLQLDKRTSNNGENVYEFEGVNLVFGRTSGDLIRGDLLSFGQKRLLSFYWYLAVRGEYPVVADELANGLHHEWIAACVNELAGRQSFLASQNPLLLDYLPAGAAESTLIHCSTESSNGHGSMVWRNFSEDEQRRLDEACAVGIQLVSEILKSQGLW